jgi:membrane-associated protein
MDTLKQLIEIFLHLDKHLNEWTTNLGGWTYGLLFLIVFCETGLVVTPFLPGDSLLFAVGALAASDGSPLSLPLAMVLLFVAAVVGDATNYAIGRRIGPRAFRSEGSIFFNKKHLLRTEAFYERHGGKTIIIARFMPIVRTFAPFVAGIGVMKYRRFFVFNVAGAAAWVVLLSVAGYAFGNIRIVKNNFELVILAIVGLSVLPMFVELVRGRRPAEVAVVDERVVPVDEPAVK